MNSIARLKNAVPLVILICSFLVILTLAFVNNGSANDNHYEVSDLIYKTDKSPEFFDCWQCYHPHLYHFTVAKTWKIFEINSLNGRHRVGQLISATAVILTILICWVFVKKQHFSWGIKCIVLSLIAFNPRLISIGGQFANDGLIILFGTLIIFQLIQIVTKPNYLAFLKLAILITLASITKANAAILVCGSFISFLVMIMVYLKESKKRNLFLRGILLICAISIPLTAYFGGYYSNLIKYGKLTVYNTETTSMPSMFEETPFRRPGVKSIYGGYFKFHYFEMIKNPIINNDKEGYPEHRTSVWSQLYGRTHFIYFDNWPAGIWQVVNKDILLSGSIALILAIFPSILFLLGVFLSFRVLCFKLIAKGKVYFSGNADWISLLFLLGFFAFIILFTLIGRDFSFMKIIYLFPGLLAALLPLLRGYEWVWQKIRNKKAILALFLVCHFALLFFYLFPIGYLINNLI